MNKQSSIVVSSVSDDPRSRAPVIDRQFGLLSDEDPIPKIEEAKASIALDNMRGVVILFVVAFHSAMAYLGFLSSSAFSFDQPPYSWRAFPMIDSHRWFGLDIFCAWQDVYLMSLFFFLSALFTWPSL